MKTTLLLPALLAVAVLSSGCVVVPRAGYGASYGYTSYSAYGPGYYPARPGVYVSRPAPRAVVRPSYGRGNRAPPSTYHGARPVNRGRR